MATYLELPTHARMPILGLRTSPHSCASGHAGGTRKLLKITFPQGTVKDAVMFAIDVGHHHFGCSAVIRLREQLPGSVLPPQMWSTFHERPLVKEAGQKTLAALQLDYLDLYLIHWPMGFKILRQNIEIPGSHPSELCRRGAVSCRWKWHDHSQQYRLSGCYGRPSVCGNGEGHWSLQLQTDRSAAEQSRLMTQSCK
ncbi:unnamed protein product [Bubo scandiacus]